MDAVTFAFLTILALNSIFMICISGFMFYLLKDLKAHDKWLAWEFRKINNKCDLTLTGMKDVRMQQVKTTKEVYK